MSYYPGDTHYFVLSITNSAGSNPSVTSAPVISVVQLGPGTLVVTSQAMVLLTGSQKLYYYAWSIPANQVSGQYAALVSYAADGVTVNSRWLETLQVGDSRVTGTVALDATVARDATVAKDATVAHGTDLVVLSPDNSAAVLAIKAKTDTLPTNPASEDTLTTLTSLLTDVSDAALGTWVIDKTVNPKTLTFQRPNGAVIAVFNITDDANETARTRQ